MYALRIFFALLIFCGVSGPSAAQGPGGVITVATRTQMKNIFPLGVSGAFLTETYQADRAGRSGLFRWYAGDLSAFVAEDPEECVYVVSNRYPATTGAWVRDHQSGSIDAEWCGARFNYNEGVGSPVDATDALNAAGALAGYESGHANYPNGGYVNLPNGAAWFSGSIVVPDYVFMRGLGEGNSQIVFGGDNSVQYPVYVGRDDMVAAFSCGLRDMTVRSLEPVDETDLGATLIYTNTCQDTGGFINLFVYSGARTAITFEEGYGGASLIIFERVNVISFTGEVGAPDNPQIIADYASAVVDATHLELQSDSSSPYATRGILIKSGYVHISNFHAEGIVSPIIVDQPTIPHHTVVFGGTGGVGCTSLVTSAATDQSASGGSNLHITIQAVLLNGCTNSYEDLRMGADPPVTTDIFVPQNF